MARLLSCVARLALAASILVGAGAYPSKVLCGDDLQAGESMMGKTTQDSTSRTVGFKKDGSAVSCGGEYEAGGAYTAYISSTDGRRLFHLEGGSFSSGSCSNKRNDDDNAGDDEDDDGARTPSLTTTRTTRSSCSSSHRRPRRRQRRRPRRPRVSVGVVAAIFADDDVAGVHAATASDTHYNRKLQFQYENGMVGGPPTSARHTHYHRKLQF